MRPQWAANRAVRVATALLRTHQDGLPAALSVILLAVRERSLRRALPVVSAGHGNASTIRKPRDARGEHARISIPPIRQRKGPDMRSIGHPDFQYTPWSAERRAAASKAARARVKAGATKSVAKAQKKKVAPRPKPTASSAQRPGQRK
jgi:hypothetical protein